MSVNFIMFFFFPDTSNKDVETREVIVGIVTDIDLVHHVAKKEHLHSRDNSISNGDSDTEK